MVDILVVEDNPNDLNLILRAFKESRLTDSIKVVRDGAAALDFLFGKDTLTHPRLANLPRLVLLDLKLPKVGGLEVLERIKADPRTRSISVVVLTSSSQERDVAECYQLGANSYILKPTEFRQFMEVVRRIAMYWLQLNANPFD